MEQENILSTYRPINSLRNWDDNPRTLSAGDFQRLKQQIQQLGQYKPLIITEDGTVLGGNMRLRAMRELGMEKIWVSVVDASTDAKKLEYALSDNDRAGTYDDQALAELLESMDEELDLSVYKVDLGSPADLEEVLQSFGPGGGDPADTEEEEQGLVSTIDQTSKPTEPKITFYFTPAEYEEATQRLQQLRDEWNCETNTQLLFKLLDRAQE